MYTKTVPFLLLLAALATGCTKASEADTATGPTLSEDLLGTWETVELKVVYDSYLGGDTTHTVEITEAQWGNLYGVRPPRTVFSADGKLRRTHLLRNGQVADVTNGVWRDQGDSLLVIEPNITFTYSHDLKNERLILTGTVDHDRDGARDDLFRAVYRLVSRTD